MTSERQIEANRRNGRKSRGPCSVVGKSTSSRNALRHGLASVTHSQPVSPEVIEGFAKALCGNDENPALFEQARIIGKNELVLRAIGAQQLAVVERLRDPSATALAKGDSRLKKARARFRKGQVAFDELVALRDRLLEKYKDELPPPIRSEQGYETMPGVSDSIPAHRWNTCWTRKRKTNPLRRRLCKRRRVAKMKCAFHIAMKPPLWRKPSRISFGSIATNGEPGLGKSRRSEPS
jgi:hypothetical protein